MKVLITGGAGYIGSHMALALIDLDISVVVLDNLTSGFTNLIPQKARFINGDFGDISLLDNIIKNETFDAVIHFAGSLKVEESVSNPFKYYENNLVKTLNFVNYLSNSKTKNLIFSSTAAVYDPFCNELVNEDSKLNPLNPYGSSKLMCERIIKDIANISQLKFFILRYFNVAGADILGRSGQLHDLSTHLIKVCIECAVKKRPIFEIFGNNYPTKDGTCIRDYIHVSDLIAGHIIALMHLTNEGKSDICNLGYGHGYSVLDIVERVKNISGYNFVVKIKERRPGDPPSLISDPLRIKTKYNWKPRHDNIDQIISSALNWEKKTHNSVK